MNVLANTASASENGGIVVFASSTGEQVSVESSDWGDGAFTKALVEGIERGQAAPRDTPDISTSDLDGFVSRQVRKLTSNQQNPVMQRPGPDFTTAVARKQEAATLVVRASAKQWPMAARPDFAGALDAWTEKRASALFALESPKRCATCQPPRRRYRPGQA